MEYTTENKTITTNNLTEFVKSTIILTKSGWEFTENDIAFQSPFLLTATFTKKTPVIPPHMEQENAQKRARTVQNKP